MGGGCWIRRGLKGGGGRDLLERGGEGGRGSRGEGSPPPAGMKIKASPWGGVSGYPDTPAGYLVRSHYASVLMLGSFPVEQTGAVRAGAHGLAAPPLSWRAAHRWCLSPLLDVLVVACAGLRV